MKRFLEMRENGELPRQHLLESGGRIGFHGKGYNEKSMFHGVNITVENNKKHSIKLRLTETGIAIDLIQEN
jgi:hypothetical protein